MKSQHRILQDVMDILLTDGSLAPAEAVPTMLHWIAYRIGVDPGMISPTVPIPAWEKLEAVDLSGLREEPADHIGEFINDHYPSYMAVASYIPYVSAVRTAERQAKMMKNDTFSRVLDRCGGSGGMMIAMWMALDQQTIVYMAEPDITSYRIAVINASLFNIPSRIIHADYRNHDIGPDSTNWRYAGMWAPPAWKHLVTAQPGK